MQTANNAQTGIRDEQVSGAGTNPRNNPGSSATENAEETILNSQEQDQPLNATGMTMEPGSETANMDEDESEVEDDEETEITGDEETETMDEELGNEDFEQDGLEEDDEADVEDSDEDEEESENEDQADTYVPSMKL